MGNLKELKCSVCGARYSGQSFCPLCKWREMWRAEIKIKLTQTHAVDVDQAPARILKED